MSDAELIAALDKCSPTREERAALKERLAQRAELLAACKAFVGYFDQAGIGELTEQDEYDGKDGFDGDTVFNVRLGRAAIAKATGK
jgi:hypothetical protein